MSALGFTDQKTRLARTVANAVDGAIYESSRSEDGGRSVVLEAWRDGRRFYVRFRGVKQSETSAEVASGSKLRLLGVGNAGGLNLIAFVLPGLRLHRPDYWRVRIEAGGAVLAIDCQDAEWWEDETPANG